MSERNLRKGTRKDYSKMEKAVDRALGDCSDDDNSDRYDACVRNHNNNKVEQDGSGGDILNHEVVIGNSDDSDNKESEYESACESDEDEEDLKEAERKLSLLKKKQRVLEQQSKRARIARETAEVEKALQQLEKDNGKQKKRKVTAKSLRAMDEVVDEVNRLMDRHMNIRAADSSGGEQEESDVISVRSAGSPGGAKKRREVRGEKEKQSEKKVSGKSKNSLNSDIRFPQKWPHSGLNPLFVNSREKNYEDLSISEFCAGYLTILEDED